MTLVKEKNNADQLFLHELNLKPFINKTLKLNKITSIGVLNVQRCKIDLTNERQFSEYFRYSFCVYRHIPEKHNGDTDDADSIDLKLNESVGVKQFKRLQN